MKITQRTQVSPKISKLILKKVPGSAELKQNKTKVRTDDSSKTELVIKKTSAETNKAK